MGSPIGMTIVLGFEEAYTYGRAHRAEVPVTFPRGIPGPFTVMAMLDPGAWTSVFSRSIAPRLGIVDVSAGQRERFTLPNGNSVWGYSHTTQIEFLGNALTIPLAFCPDFPEGSPNLLGMRGFFEQLTVALEHGSRKVYAKSA